MIVRRRFRRHNPHRAHRGAPPPAGALPTFSRPLGLDFVITPEGRVVLIELQHGFGRLGLLKLFPLANRVYRKAFWYLRRQRGRSPWITERLRQICGDKIKTYKLFAELQPSSRVYRAWTPAVAAWLEGLQTDYVLLKPPRGSCGEGIVIFEREALLRSKGQLIAPMTTMPVLLQAFVLPRLLRDATGTDHVGCIRHILLLHSDGAQLNFIHLPSYWRVSPTPFVDAADKDALTANISRGATPLQVDAAESAHVREVAEQITTRLLEQILGLESIVAGTRHVISASGELPLDLVGV